MMTLKHTMKCLRPYLPWLVVSVTLVFVTSCSHNGPQLNANPKHTVTIKGHIDQQLQGKIYLAFTQYYSTYNKDCQITTNWLEGIKSYPGNAIGLSHYH